MHSIYFKHEYIYIYIRGNLLSREKWPLKASRTTVAGCSTRGDSNQKTKKYGVGVFKKIADLLKVSRDFGTNISQVLGAILIFATRIPHSSNTHTPMLPPNVPQQLVLWVLMWSTWEPPITHPSLWGPSTFVYQSCIRRYLVDIVDCMEPGHRMALGFNMHLPVWGLNIFLILSDRSMFLFNTPYIPVADK